MKNTIQCHRYLVIGLFAAALLVLAGTLLPGSTRQEAASSPAVQYHRTLEEAIAAVRGERPFEVEATNRLTAGSPRSEDNFGWSVSVSGDTAVVGAPLSNNGGVNNNGTAYVFVRNGSGWTQQQRLTTPDGIAGDRDGFGTSVSISGDTLIVGAPKHGDESQETTYGAAYLFVRTNSSWTLQKKFSPADTPLAKCEGQFGIAVAVSGETAMVGTGGCLQFSDHSSMVHVFVREGTTWTVQALLTAIEEGNDDSFGEAIALSGDVAVIGDPDRSGQSPQGAWVFTRCGTEWTREQKLVPADGVQSTRFGHSVAISGTTVVVGAPNDRSPGLSNTPGAAYIFVKNDTTWTQQQKLSANSGTISSVNFGSGVAILGDTVVVGKRAEGTSPNIRGQALVYTRSGTSWTLEQTYTGTGGVNDFFGYSVAISENAVIVGAILEGGGAGAAYAIDRTTVGPTSSGSPCDEDIEVNLTTDEPDSDLEDDICDVNANQSGNQCSLRAAIQTANAKEGPDTILFNIPGGGIKTISPATSFPQITEQVTFDGTTQSGYVGKPRIQLHGGIPGVETGLIFGVESDGSIVRGISINRFPTGIKIASNGNTIERSYIGLDADGVTIPAEGSRQGIGIEITGKDNIVGGVRDTLDGSRANTYVTGNRTKGILIRTSNATGNKVNGINFGFLDNEDLPAPDQITITQLELAENTSNNTIGSEPLLERNLMVNAVVGIHLESAAHDNKVIGNVIAQIFTGISVFGAHDNTIGGVYNSGARNWLIDNEVAIQIGATPAGRFSKSSTLQEIDKARAEGSEPVVPAVGNKVYGNVLGLNPSGDKFFEINDVGIVVGASEATEIGTGEFGYHNFVGNSEQDGIIITKLAQNAKVRGNFIGSDLTGQSLAANRSGILIHGSGALVTNNVVSGNNDDGIRVIAELIGDPDPTGVRIIDNTIGTNGAGTTSIPNGSNGIYLEGSEHIISENTISGNDEYGIWVLGNDNQISSNRIGTNKAGTTAIGNQRHGLAISGSRNIISLNTVSGNHLSGITVAPTGAKAPRPDRNVLTGNFVGTNSAGTEALPNTLDGIIIAAADNTRIGGFGANIPAERNIISGNLANGISLISGAMFTRISGNYIGTGTDGASALGNTGRGIRVGTSVSNTIIGGPEQNAGNTIGFNGSNGISLANDAGNNNIIDPNRIFGNALAGIDIGENGLTPNDPTDADVGPNKLQNFPTFTLSIVGGDLVVNYRVDSAPQHSTYGASGIYVEFFKADATGAGRDFLGSDHYLLSDYSNGLPGIRQKNLGNAASLGVAAGDSLTATATDADGNSSEFSPAFPVASTPVTISGRVTTPTGLGLRNATVSLIAPSGERRLATTSSFGIYNFADVASGLNYTITVTSKRYRFAPRIQTISQSVSNLDFTGLE